jgi:hypothetical protein
MNAGIRKNNLQLAPGGRIIIQNSLNVGFDMSEHVDPPISPISLPHLHTSPRFANFRIHQHASTFSHP